MILFAFKKICMYKFVCTFKSSGMIYKKIVNEEVGLNGGGDGDISFMVLNCLK